MKLDVQKTLITSAARHAAETAERCYDSSKTAKSVEVEKGLKENAEFYLRLSRAYSDILKGLINE